MTLTTASQTADNVTRLLPYSLITRFDSGNVDVHVTAERFVDANFRHIVNRRMKWSTTAAFVNAACVNLLFNLAGRLSNSSTDEAINDLFDSVRVASNRRWSWKEARVLLLINTRDLIQAALRML